MTSALLDFHAWWAWVAIGGNALAGLYALAAWRIPRLRGTPVWAVTAAAQVALMVQVVVGVVAISDEAVVVPRFHMFYGFVGFITVGLAYSYRSSMRGRLEMFYGFVGLFLMGVGLRAWLQVV